MTVVQGVYLQVLRPLPLLALLIAAEPLTFCTVLVGKLDLPLLAFAMFCILL